MANRTYRPIKGSLTREIALLCGDFTTTTSGTIAASPNTGMGFTVVKTATKTGRYTVTMDKYVKFYGALVTVEGSADAAYTAGKGIVNYVRNVNPTAGTFDIQFTRANGTTDYNDTELADGAKVYLVITVANASNT